MRSPEEQPQVPQTRVSSVGTLGRRRKKFAVIQGLHFETNERRCKIERKRNVVKAEDIKAGRHGARKRARKKNALCLMSESSHEMSL